jgi:AcrR family transcriptional regulator
MATRDKHMNKGEATPIKRRKRRRKDVSDLRAHRALVRAGQLLFGERGVESTSIDDILRTARVSRGSFYNHFEDKTALIKEVLRASSSNIEQVISVINRDEQDPAIRVARAMCAYAREALDDPPHALFILRVLIHTSEPDAPKGMVDDVTAGMAKGRLAVFTLETGVAFILGICKALIQQALVAKSLPMVVAVTQQFVTLTLRALGVPQLEAELIAAKTADEVVRQARPAKDGSEGIKIDKKYKKS